MHVLAPPGLASLLGGLSKGGTHALQCQHDFLASFTRPQQDCARGIGEQGDVDRQPTQQRRDVGMTCEHTALVCKTSCVNVNAQKERRGRTPEQCCCRCC